MSVYGGLDVVELDPASGVLRARVGVYAVEIPKADVLGIDEPARRLTQALAEGGLESLLGPIEVPVRIEDRLRLPALRTRRVSIPALDVAVAATVSSVRVFAGKLWVGVRAQVANPGGEACAFAGRGLSVRRLLLAAGLLALGSAPHPAAPRAVRAADRSPQLRAEHAALERAAASCRAPGPAGDAGARREGGRACSRSAPTSWRRCWPRWRTSTSTTSWWTWPRWTPMPTARSAPRRLSAA